MAARAGGSGAGRAIASRSIGVGLRRCLWLFSGFFQVKAAERGVIQRFGKLVMTTREGWGWHLPWPIETVTKVNVPERQQQRLQVARADRGRELVDLRFAVQYRYADPIKVAVPGARSRGDAAAK